jgi:hypothetical protein
LYGFHRTHPSGDWRFVMQPAGCCIVKPEKRLP